MSGNSFGEIFKVTTFGESHGQGLGCIIDGCPAGLSMDADFLQHELDRRRPGSGGAAVTARKEQDQARILSGVFEGRTTGTPIAILIENTNQHSGDYAGIARKFRPGHADFTYTEKYGIRDYRGGGRASGRETCARVAAGAVAKMLLREFGVTVTAYTKEAAGISCSSIDFTEIERNAMRAPDKDAAERMLLKIEEIRRSGDSAGGIIECVAQGVKSGLGEPVFDKADSLLAHAVLSVGAVKGIEFGAGFGAASLLGSQNNDSIRSGNGGAGGKTNASLDISFCSNNAGGILGGITSGNDIIFRAAVKPVPSIYTVQKTVDVSGGDTEIKIEGRHDVCLCPRIVPVIEAMTAITLADLYLRDRASKV
ncbi:MAG: chorismate synthase [Treponema sp.]|nr:chorismate synthase [Treponema sp.]